MTEAACTFATYAPALKPVTANGWVVHTNARDAAEYRVGDITLRVFPIRWNERSFAGPGLPVFPMPSSGTEPLPSIYIVAFSVHGGNANLQLQDTQLRCTPHGQAMQTISYELRIERPSIASLIPHSDLRIMEKCTLHFSDPLAAGPAVVPDLSFELRTVFEVGGT